MQTNNWFVLLGREWKLGAAEVAALAPDATLTLTQPILRSEQDAAASIPDWDRCGGVVRAGAVVASQPTSSTVALAETIIGLLPPKDTKFSIGLSAPLMASPRYSQLCKAVKQAAQAANRKVHIVRSQKDTVLNIGEITSNLLARKGGEFFVWQEGNQTFVGQATWQQDVAAYAARDQARPARDARVGMLPPKLAQTLINLAQVPAGEQIYDPFCGTSVVLQEALRMNYLAAGSDLSTDMVKASEKNLAWYTDLESIPTNHYSVKQLDARKLSDNPEAAKITAIVCEGWLGDAGLLEASPERIKTEANKLSAFYSEVFTNWQKLPNLQQIVCALPVWYVNEQIISLPLLDVLESVGYAMEQFAPFEDTRLMYRRPDQTVGRMIVKLRKI